MIRKIVGVIIISLGIGLIGFGAYGMFLGIVFGGIAIIFSGLFIGLTGYRILIGERFDNIADIIRWIP